MVRSTGLGQSAARGALVTITGQVARIGIQLVGIAVLARLLDPQTYGLLAMVMVVISLGEIFRDFGLSPAAVQTPGLTTVQRDNLFWANSGLGLGLAVGAVGMAEVVAAFYREPEVAPITRVLALTFVINGMAAQYRASLTRDMRFVALTSIEVAAQVLGLLTGVMLALSGAGYWSLVAQQLCQGLVGLALLATTARWRPRRPRRGQDMARFWRFGWNLVATQLLGFLTSNVDSLVLGRRSGAEVLGIYDRAYRVIMVPLAQVLSPSTTVALPVLSRIGQDHERAAVFLVRGQIALGYSVVLGLGYACGAAEPLVAIFLGPGWESSAPIVAILAIAGTMQTLAFVGYWVYLSRALTGYLFRYTLLAAFVRVAAILVGSNWGIIGVALGVAIAPALLWPVSLWWLSKVTPLPLRTLVGGGARVLGMTATSALVVRFVTDALSAVPPVIGAAAGLLTVVAVYGIAAVVLPPVRRDVRDVWDVLVRVRARPRQE